MQAGDQQNPRQHLELRVVPLKASITLGKMKSKSRTTKNILEKRQERLDELSVSDPEDSKELDLKEIPPY